MSNSVLRQNPIVIVRDLAVVQCVAYALFLGAGLLADYGAWYSASFLANIISYGWAYVLMQAVGEVAIAAYAFLRWHLTYYAFHGNEVVFSSGVLFRRKRAYQRSRFIPTGYQYGLLGRLFSYATLVLKDTQENGRTVRLPFMAAPATAQAAFRGEALEENAPAQFAVPETLDDILRSGEGEQVEFKSSLRFDRRLNRVNRELEKAAMKTVAAFLNSGGGHLVLGVADNGDVVGIAEDLQSLNRPDADGFENHFTLAFNSYIGPQFRHLVKLRFHALSGSKVCAVHVAPARHPAYVQSENSEAFYVRTGNTTTALKPSEIVSYVNARRPGSFVREA